VFKTEMEELRDIPGQPSYQCSRAGKIYSLKSGAPKEMSLFVRGRIGHLGVNLNDGRSAKGERVAGAKLTADRVISIRSRMHNGELPSLIARELGMALSTICDIQKRKHWKHI